MTDEQKAYNGRVIEELCKLGDRVLEMFGQPPDPREQYFTREQIRQDEARIRDMQNVYGVND